MNSLEIINDSRAEVESLCRKYAVETLRPCGVTAKGSWDLFTADFQFVVEFDPAFQAEHGLDPYFLLRTELEEVLHGSVDLFGAKAAANWWNRLLQRSIERGAIDWYPFKPVNLAVKE